ncbi:integrase [Candidatus Termititenax aidoneus]|uniref:Integrase n=1 Tax=Termititenax aidoneus TaxID=2218524 RepID=A0A388TBI4_TERA1|nr:integrase [Candidatus Termititenax aidoneus]
MASIRTRTLKDGSKSYEVCFRTYTANGIEYRSDSFRNKEQAKRRRAEIEQQLIANKYGWVEFKPVSFSRFVDENYMPAYLDNKALKPKTVKVYLNACNHLKKYFQHRKMDTITTEDIMLFKNTRAKETGNRTVNIDLLTLKQICDHAITNSYIKNNPYISKRIGKLPENVRERYLTVEEEKQLLDNATAWAQYVITVCLQTGLRHNELSNFLFSDINYTNNYITVRAEISKNKKSRTIPITSTLKSALQFLSENWINPLTSKIMKRQEQQKRYVFCNESGERIKSFKKTVTNTVRKAGLKDVSMHTFRKTLASRLVQKGISPQIVAEILGHSSTQVTIKHYAFLNNQTKQEAMLKLNTP